LIFNARLKTIEGKLDDAFLDIRDGVALAKRVGEANTLLSLLVGVAIFSQQANEIEFFVQQPGAPNLYWALTDLPSPFMNKQSIIEGELRGMSSMLAVMKEAEKATLSEDKAQELFIKVAGMLKKVGGEGNFSPLEELGMKTGLTLVIPAQQESAKKILQDAGKSDKEISAMAPTQRYLLAEWIVCQDLNDTMYTLFQLPISQATKEFVKQEKHLKEMMAKSGSMNPLRTMLIMVLPAIQRAYQANVRLERQIAALRCVEAIRMYAARESRLPEKLEDITDVVLPNDPLFDKPIDYKIEGDKGILLLPNWPDDKPTTSNNFRYEITLAK
jgi:hypothetical protein